MAILLLQYGHSFVSGAFSSLCPNLSPAAFIAFTMQNTISAMIRKLTTAVRNFSSLVSFHFCSLHFDNLNQFLILYSFSIYLQEIHYNIIQKRNNFIFRRIFMKCILYEKSTSTHIIIMPFAWCMR